MIPPTMEFNRVFTASRLLVQLDNCFGGELIFKQQDNCIHIPVASRLPAVLHVVLELGLGAAGPEGDDDPVVEGERDPIAVETDGQRRHVVRVGRVEARVLVAHRGDHVRDPVGGGHRPWILEGRKGKL